MCSDHKFQDMDLHISDWHKLCSVDILSSQHIQVYNLVDFLCNSADMSKLLDYSHSYTGYLVHKVMAHKGLQVLVQQLH